MKKNIKYTPEPEGYEPNQTLSDLLQQQVRQLIERWQSGAENLWVQWLFKEPREKDLAIQMPNGSDYWVLRRRDHAALAEA